MGLVDEMYGPGFADPAPPEAQRWSFFLSHGVKPVCTFVRRHEGAAWGPPRIVVAYPDARPEIPPDPLVAWDPVLEDWLLAHRVQAVSPGNEAERIGFDLGMRLAAIEKRWTTPAFISVLMRFLYDDGCPLYLSLEKRLGAIRAYEPDAAEARTAVCQAIKAVIHDVAAALDALGYAPEVAQQIKDAAVAYYLRDRFQIDEAVTARSTGPMPVSRTGG